MSNKKEPLETLRDGALKATFWLNDGKNGKFITVTPGKTFETQDGKLKDSNSYSGTELLRMSEIFREAHYRNIALREEHGLKAHRPKQADDRQQQLPIEQAGDQKEDQVQEQPEPRPNQRKQSRGLRR